MTIPEAAKELGLAASTLRRQRQNGKLRARFMGGRYYVSEEEVARYRTVHMGQGRRTDLGGKS